MHLSLYIYVDDTGWYSLSLMRGMVHAGRPVSSCSGGFIYRATGALGLLLAQCPKHRVRVATYVYSLSMHILPSVQSGLPVVLWRVSIMLSAHSCMCHAWIVARRVLLRSREPLPTSYSLNTR